MPNDALTEQRLAAVERAIAELQQRLADHADPSLNWIQRITGSFKDDPAFAEVVRFGLEFRVGHQLPEDFEP